MPHILLADDDVELSAMLSEYFTAEGFVVDTTYDGDETLSKAKATSYDLIVLDVMMPRKNGIEVLRELRREFATPVLMLTARQDDVDSIVGLELGADDYLGKPCNPRVLVAHMRSILRRSAERGIVSVPDKLQINDLEMHVGSRTVMCGSLRIDMTSTEYSVLEALVREAGHVVSKEDLSERALGRKLGRFDRSLDMHVSNLRKKLGPLPGGEERIATVRGVGYQYVAI
jgi:DNA-binding response OmpR family regulator